MRSARDRLRAAMALVWLVGSTAFAGVLAMPAQAEGVTRQMLEAKGWTCVPFPFPPATPIRYSCFNPGLGRPLPNNPDPPPSYTFLAFDAVSGDFIGTGHLIRQDVYSEQPCAPGGEPYVFRPLIGYFECIHQ